MPAPLRWITLAAFGVLTACFSPGPGPQKRAETPKAPPAEVSAHITQLYTTKPKLAPGETALVCYGVENATRVWLEPPPQELSAAISRCVEVTPVADTTYKLTAQGVDGKNVTGEVRVAIGAARPRIVNVTVNALEVKAHDLVSICYAVENARTVTIDPLGFRGQSGKGCATDQPAKSTTYTISAVGAGGDKDQERVTVKVK